MRFEFGHRFRQLFVFMWVFSLAVCMASSFFPRIEEQQLILQRLGFLAFGSSIGFWASAWEYLRGVSSYGIPQEDELKKHLDRVLSNYCRTLIENIYNARIEFFGLKPVNTRTKLVKKGIAATGTIAGTAVAALDLLLTGGFGTLGWIGLGCGGICTGSTFDDFKQSKHWQKWCNDARRKKDSIIKNWRLFEKQCC